jgi:hypothetical protein
MVGFRTVLLSSLAFACGARTELGAPIEVACTDCDAGRDVVVVDGPHDVTVDVPVDVSTDVPITNLCGNGVLDPGEQCDLGASNSDTPIPFLVSQSGGGSFDVTPLERAESAVAFYDYVGASSHDGLEVLEESRLFLYLDSATSELSLILNHNIFGQGIGSATASIQGLPVGFTLDLSDDAGELTVTGATTAAGNWHWMGNTDGGVLGSLTCPSAWSITASLTFTAGISSWVWVNADTSRTSLTMGDPVTIQSFDRCRTDCTIPPCGQ